MPALGAFSQNYITPLWTSESAAAAAARLAVRQLKGRIGADSAASMWSSRASVPADSYTVLSWPAASLQSTGRCATTTIWRTSHNPQTRALWSDRPQLSLPLCLHHGMPGFTPRLHAHPSTAGAAGRTLLPGLTTQPLLECLSSIRPIFLNFVTFSTKHGSTSDKACSRPLGSRYVHANAHRRPRSRFAFLQYNLRVY